MHKIADVKDYEGLYFIGDDFEIYNAKTLQHIKPHLTNKGYKRVCLYKNKKMARISVHRIVATALVPNPENKPMVNHIDNDRTNNNQSNLEWVTCSENLQHMHNQKRHKRSPEGERNRLLAVKHKQGKLTYKQAEEIRQIKGKTQREIAKMYNVSQYLIGRVLRYETYKKEDFIKVPQDVESTQKLRLQRSSQRDAR